MIDAYRMPAERPEYPPDPPVAAMCPGGVQLPAWTASGTGVWSCRWHRPSVWQRLIWWLTTLTNSKGDGT